MKRTNEDFEREFQPKQSRISLRQVNVHAMGLCGNVLTEDSSGSFDTFTPSKPCEIKSNIRKFMSASKKSVISAGNNIYKI